jgi:hypothetical protein
MNNKFKLMRRPENNSNWEILIIASLDTCKEYQEEDDVEFKECPNPEYKIIPILEQTR